MPPFFRPGWEKDAKQQRTIRDAMAHSDKAIAESKRLKDELYLAVMKAKRFDEHLNFLHWVRIEEDRRKKK